MAHTAFNLTGFVQPYYIMSRYLADNHDGLMDRLLVSCPQRLKVYWESLRSDMPRHIPSPYLLFSMLRQAHARQDDKKYTYTLTDAARASYGEFFNFLEDEMDKFDNDEDCQSILSKMKGKTACIAMSLTGLDQAADFGIAIQAHTRKMDQDAVDNEWGNFSQRDVPDDASSVASADARSVASGVGAGVHVQDDSFRGQAGYEVNLQAGVTCVDEALAQWSYQITGATMRKAIALARYFLEQQFAVMPEQAAPTMTMPDMSLEGINREKLNLSNTTTQKLLVRLIQMGPKADTSDIVRKKCMPALRANDQDRGYHKKA